LKKAGKQRRKTEIRPEINFRAESSSLLKQASASSRAIYRSA